MRAKLGAGDALLFNSWGFHRGRYHADKPRRTLMWTFTPADMPTFDYCAGPAPGDVIHAPCAFPA